MFSSDQGNLQLVDDYQRHNWNGMVILNGNVPSQCVRLDSGT